MRTKEKQFTKSSHQDIYSLEQLKITEEYSLRVINALKIGHSVILNGYALKRVE